MYGRHFESMYEGSMYGAGVAVFAVWGYVISHARHGVVELNAKKLADTLGGTVEQIEEAMRFLEQPDRKSRFKEDDGRRLVREGEFQYRLPSWEKYAAIKNEEDRREYNRSKQAEHRARVREATKGMTAREKMAWEASRKREHRKRRKEVDSNGACFGAQQAINEGLNETRLGQTEAL